FYYLFAYLSFTVKKPLVTFASNKYYTPDKLIEKFKFIYSDLNTVKRKGNELIALFFVRFKEVFYCARANS
ncbi:hypothetical protein QBC45DRAFT_336582, partial [Copromyces sp. CBS 386.78]